MSIPFTSLGIVSDIHFRVVKEDVQTLPCLLDMKKIGLDLSIQRNCLMFLGGTEKVTLDNDLLYHRCYPDVVLYTTAEIVKPYRSFGHPSVTALTKLLQKARPDEMDSEVRAAIQDSSERCKVCSELEKKPKRFKLTTGDEGGCFNSVVAVDIMYIDENPILQLVDEATHFAAATFLKNVSSKETWKASMKCWCLVYMGPPDYLRIDQGSNFVSKEFRASASAHGIEILEAPIESPNTITHVERYHGPLRTAFKRLHRDIP